MLKELSVDMSKDGLKFFASRIFWYLPAVFILYLAFCNSNAVKGLF